MHSARSVKVHYVAAFVLGALIALLVAAPARAASTIPADQVVFRSALSMQGWSGLTPGS